MSNGLFSSGFPAASHYTKRICNHHSLHGSIRSIPEAAEHGLVKTVETGRLCLLCGSVLAIRYTARSVRDRIAQLCTEQGSSAYSYYVKTKPIMSNVGAGREWNVDSEDHSHHGKVQ